MVGTLAAGTPPAGTLVTLFSTFVLFSLGYAATAHVAARYVLGDVPVRRALLVGPAPALASVLLQAYGPAITIAVTFLVDYAAIHVVYRLSYGRAAVVAVVHYTVTVIVGITLFNLLRLLATMPG